MSKPNIKNITCEIKEQDNYYEFTTFEPIRKCLVCKSVYTKLNREYCLNCKKKNNLKIKLYDYEKERGGKLTKDLTKYWCSCVYSSFFGWAKSKISNNEMCKHVLVAIRTIKKKEKNKKNDNKNKEKDRTIHATL